MSQDSFATFAKFICQKPNACRSFVRWSCGRPQQCCCHGVLPTSLGQPQLGNCLQLQPEVLDQGIVSSNFKHCNTNTTATQTTTVSVTITNLLKHGLSPAFPPPNCSCAIILLFVGCLDFSNNRSHYC